MDLPRAGELTSTDAGSLGAARYPLEGRYVCPFCGAVNETMEGPCPQCTMTNTAETRKATKSRIGPWYVLQSRNPAAPGMRYETLLGFVRKGRVKARSIVRGPTTHQLWRFACQVKGLSREFGLCYSCGGSIERDAQLCPQCNRLQDPPADPDVFLEGMVAAPSSAADAPASVAPRAVSPVEAWQDSRQGPIFKELKLPPLASDPVPATEPTPVPAAPMLVAGAGPVAAPAASPVAESPVTAAPVASAPPSSVPRQEPSRAPAAEGPPKRNAKDVFLSARDLAAAFQLGFDGESDGSEGRPGTAGDAAAPWAASARGESARAAPHPYRRHRRKRRVGRTLLVLLLLGVAGIIAWLAFDPAARQRVFAWADAKYMALTGANLYPDLARPRTGAAPATTPSGFGPVDEPVAVGASVVPPGPATPVVGARGVSRESSAVSDDAKGIPATTGPSESGRVAPPAPPPKPQVTATAPVAAPAAGRLQPSTSPSASAGQVAGPAQTQAAARPRPDAGLREATQPAEAPRPSLAEAHRRSRELWDEALRAEESGDYRKARALYQQMMKLPREVWYQGVEANLRFAEEMLGEK